MNRPFDYGDKVLLLDNKQRRYLITLAEGAEFHTHAGLVPHAEIVGKAEGIVDEEHHGRVVHRRCAPRWRTSSLEMPRGAQVIYPKDLGPICMLADIGPGVRVLESGVGSGALSMTMLRYGAEIVGYELREDFLNRARANVRSVPRRGRAGAATTSHLRDCYEGIDERDVDRVVLDLPEPWQVVPHAMEALRPGGILVAYTPVDHPGGADPRGHGQPGVERHPHARGAAPRLAHRGPGRAPRPPHGGPHRLPHRRPLPRLIAAPTCPTYLQLVPGGLRLRGLVPCAGGTGRSASSIAVSRTGHAKATVSVALA